MGDQMDFLVGTTAEVVSAYEISAHTDFVSVYRSSI
jgi:hypothetical protein